MPVDIFSTVNSAIELALKVYNQLQALDDIKDDAKLLAGQVHRVSALLSWLRGDDVKATISPKQWQSTFTVEALTAIEDVLKQIDSYAKTLCKKSFVAKLFTAGDILNALKSATVRLSHHLIELHFALGIEQYASLCAQDIEQRAQAIERHAQLLEQFGGVQAELQRLRPTIQAVRDTCARQSPGGTTPAANASADVDNDAGLGPGALAAQLREELQVAQHHHFRPAQSKTEEGLLAAAKGGDVGEVLKQLKLAPPGTSLNSYDEDGYRPLHVAAESGSTLLVLELLKLGCDVRAKSKNGYTPLHLAALSNDEEAVRLLVGSGAAVEAENKKGETPLHVACLRNHVAVVKALIGMGANVHARTQSSATPLWVCCNAGGTGAAAVGRLLLQKGAKADDQDAKGCAPLHAACRTCGPVSAALVTALVMEGKVSAELADTVGRTPLLIATESGNADAVAALLSLGASVDARTWGGLLTPLHVAAQYNQLEVAAKLRAPGNRLVDGKLVKVKKAEVDARDQHGSREVADLLLSHRADIEAKNREGLQPVHVAAHKNQVGVLKLLLDKGAKVDSKTKDGKTPMELAPVDSQAAALLQEPRKKSWRIW
ncbi:hypothetical protein HYH03_005933 [Edaphochlamys debaryana]|uniref:Ankyrin repeat protein n=1 Tax=Edaphochlamys debaryana TaxID=47281 RepID=A0A835Y885_9CHLO|nr:hypothetical protein HYH03_005933 [Edaphochlamys debaryana]|eukprot:KAG2496011.1 hypothetical protein HYH03_005933 [Edaphochlamys debaryana]